MDSSSRWRFKFSLFDRLFTYIDSLRPTDRFIFSLILLVFVTSSIWSLYQLGRSFLVQVPADGGHLIEGAVGSPRFINPVLAITKADNDLVALTYSGLLRLAPDGTLANDLAESVTVSDDGLVYNVILKRDRHWHDGVAVTAEDVAFTINSIQNQALKSPLRGNWSGVTVELINTHELNFVLDQAYAPFVENLTVGILPKHIWDTLSDEELPLSQYNIEPIGSGPYQVKSVTRNPSGLISVYNLETAPEFATQTHINNVTVHFYQNEEAIVAALRKGEINATAALSKTWLSSLDSDSWQVINEPLPRVFSIFFNQNKTPVLRDQAVRKALSVMVDRNELVTRVTQGYGQATEYPLPTDWLPNATSTAVLTKEERAAAAKQILEDGGWTMTGSGGWEKTIDEVNVPLMISIRSANGVLFESIASYITEVWQELGVKVDTELYEQSDLVQTIIRPRDYQALLFGTDVGRSLDLYPFWHSSQREDPGLNVSLYANITVDDLVSSIRTATSTEMRNELIDEFVNELSKEQPALFLFSPSFLYVLDADINTAQMEYIQKPSERFSNITDWYINKNEVWSMFAK